MAIINYWDGKIRGKWELVAANKVKRYREGSQTFRDQAGIYGVSAWKTDGTEVGRSWTFYEIHYSNPDNNRGGSFTIAGSLASGAYVQFDPQSFFPDVAGVKFYREPVLTNGGLKFNTPAPNLPASVLITLPLGRIVNASLEFVTDSIDSMGTYDRYTRRCIISSVEINNQATCLFNYDARPGVAVSQRTSSNPIRNTIFFNDACTGVYTAESASSSNPWLSGFSAVDTLSVADGTHDALSLVNAGYLAKIESTYAYYRFHTSGSSSIATTSPVSYTL